MKANRKVQPSKKMKRTSPAEAETMSPEELAEEQRSFDRFANGMRTYLREMEKDQRDALLRELHRLGNVKTFLDSFTATNREKVLAEIARFRKYRLWLADMDAELSKARKAMLEAVDVANNNPRKDNPDELETLIVNKTLTALARAMTGLERVVGSVEYTQYLLAAAIPPEKRVKPEKKLVPQEPKGLKHTDLPLSEKTKQIDMSFIRYAASSLDKYHTKDGKPIRNYDQIISRVFESAFCRIRTAESIRRVLSRSRRKPS